MEKFEKEDVSVVWNSEKCIHAGFCAKQLPQVFNPKEKPWIQTKHATKAEIVDQVSKCPSGALSIE